MKTIEMKKAIKIYIALDPEPNIETLKNTLQEKLEELLEEEQYALSIAVGGEFQCYFEDIIWGTNWALRHCRYIQEVLNIKQITKRGKENNDEQKRLYGNCNNFES